MTVVYDRKIENFSRKKKYWTINNFAGCFVFHIVKQDKWLFATTKSGFPVYGGYSSDYCPEAPTDERLEKFKKNLLWLLTNGYNQNPEQFKTNYKNMEQN